MKVIKVNDLRKAVYKCDCGRLFPCLLGLSAHMIGKHKRNLLACPNHRLHSKHKGGARLRFTLKRKG